LERTPSKSIIPTHLVIVDSQNRDDKCSTSIADALDKYMASQDNAVASRSHDQFPLCSYHTQLQQRVWAGANPLDGPSVMERFLAEAESEQHAVFVRPDNGKLSITSTCTCASNVDGATLQTQMAKTGIDGVHPANSKDEKDA
jgi:hypothetical protein